MRSVVGKARCAVAVFLGATFLVVSGGADDGDADDGWWIGESQGTDDNGAGMCWASNQRVNPQAPTHLPGSRT